MAIEANRAKLGHKVKEEILERVELTQRVQKVTVDLMQKTVYKVHPASMDYLVTRVKKIFFNNSTKIRRWNFFSVEGYAGLDGTYGRDGDKGFKGGKGERSDISNPWCKGSKGEAGTIVYFSGRNATTVIKGDKGRKGDKGPAGDDGNHGRTGSPGPAGFRGTKGM